MFRPALLFTVLLLAATTFAQDRQETYPPHPDSLPRDGVPKGELKGPFEFRSEIFPATIRNYWIYVPSAYDASKPACLMVVQDGLNRAKGWKLPTVMDNLIHDGDMPMTIGVFIDHGKVIPDREGFQPRFNRSFEYDSVGDSYARFLVDEILPEVSSEYNISEDPNDRSIAGSSSGAICAFNVAWERPDQFRRVFSAVGTYVGLRGAEELPSLVRKFEPKPLRVFLQDGSNDLDIYAGDWWSANQRMLSALTFAGYEVNHVWGTGGHNAKHATAILPDALRWLWANHGEPIQRGQFKSTRIKVLVPGQRWTKTDDDEVAKGLSSPKALPKTFAVDPQASVLYRSQAGERLVTAHDLDSQGNIISTQPFGYLHLTPNQTQSGAGAMTVDQNGSLYVCTDLGIQILDPLGRVNLILEKPSTGDLTEIGFVGEDRKTLAVRCGNELYTRKVETAGVSNLGQPNSIPKPGL
ncbi:MAG: alpha/beta hydrolase-fold protein [Planctomycetota bacterium]